MLIEYGFHTIKYKKWGILAKKNRKAPCGSAVQQNACFRGFHLSHDIAKTLNCMILKLLQMLNNILKLHMLNTIILFTSLYLKSFNHLEYASVHYIKIINHAKNPLKRSILVYST